MPLLVSPDVLYMILLEAQTHYLSMQPLSSFLPSLEGKDKDVINESQRGTQDEVEEPSIYLWILGEKD